METTPQAAPANSAPPTESTSMQQPTPSALVPTSTQSQNEPWYSSLPDELKSDGNITKFTSVAELAKGYNNASAAD